METVLFLLYVLAVGILTLYGLNSHVMVHLFKRQVRRCTVEDQTLIEKFYAHHTLHDFPKVTSQIPIYNEMNVAERVIDAVSAFDYPSEKHEIQVLDDSTDETSHVIARKIASLQASGITITHIRRTSREGFKAGALKYGIEQAQGEFLAIFDADFIPPRDFLRKTIPFFVLDPQLGFIQSRWGHLNRNENLLTRLQSFVLDGLFVIEQSARDWNNLFMGFNGTAGIMRKQAILDAGNWKDDTLTEDLDLSFRMQLAGWKTHYLLDVVSPSEIPRDIHAFKNQQFRWAKGTTQTAMKLLPSIWRSDFPFFKKFQATLQLTHHLAHPLMVFLILITPVLLLTDRMYFSHGILAGVGGILLLSFMGPSRLYWTAQRYLNTRWTKQMLSLPLLVCLGGGLAINNSKAVLEALLGKRSEFVRTPKQGNLPKTQYKPTTNLLFILEIIFGLWNLLGISLYITHHNYFVGYIFFLYALGSLYIGGLSFLYFRRYLRYQRHVPSPH